MVLVVFLTICLLDACSVAAASPSPHICNSTECNDISRFLTALIDAPQDPCTDFFKFACGKRTPKNLKAASLQDSVIATVQRDNTFDVVQALRHRTFSGPKTPASVKKAADLYAQCSSYDSSVPKAQKEILSYFSNFAHWPLLTTSWKTKDFDIVEVAGRLKAKHGLNALVALDVQIDVFKLKRKALYLGSADFDYDLSDYNESVNANFRQEYKLNVSRALQQLILSGIAKPMTTKDINKVAEEIVEFESAIALNAAPTPPNILAHLEIFHRLSLNELNKVYNNTKIWHQFFLAAFQNDSVAMKWLTQHKVIVNDFNYFTGLAKQLLSNPDQIRVAANYLMWRLLVKLSPFFDPDVLYIEKKNTDDSAPDQKHRNCFEDVKSTFTRALDWIYVNAEGKKLYEKREPLFQVVKDLTATAGQMINSSTWLNQKAKQRLLLKLSRMRTVIAFPDWLTKVTSLDELYSWKQVNLKNSYLQNLLSCSKWDYSELLEASEEHFFNVYSQQYYEVNAEYQRPLNAFLIPAGIMSDTFFKPNYTAAFKYGLLGAVLAHEMFHGYDTGGIQYDEDGRTTNITEMLGDSQDEFKKRADCVVHAYAKKCYPIKYKQTLEWAGQGNRLRKRAADDEGEDDIATEKFVTKKVCINGEATLEENLADLNGLKAAWRSYIVAADREHENDAANFRVTHLDKYTPSQLFFLSYAAFFCANDQSSQLYSIKTGDDGHSTNEARVNVNLANFEPFAQTWKCKAGTKMATKNRCEMF